MSQFIIETRVHKGHLEVKNIPFFDDTEVKVIVIPKAYLNKMLFLKAQKFTKPIKGNISEDMTHEAR
ncbi:MAG: hypothetical protein ACE5GL_03415 [Calditrichia bacterium]